MDGRLNDARCSSTLPVHVERPLPRKPWAIAHSSCSTSDCSYRVSSSERPGCPSAAVILLRSERLCAPGSAPSSCGSSRSYCGCCAG
eukprot:7385849-Prymnesium_polylepis.2